jgi:hypothetical protein
MKYDSTLKLSSATQVEQGRQWITLDLLVYQEKEIQGCWIHWQRKKEIILNNTIANYFVLFFIHNH